MPPSNEPIKEKVVRQPTPEPGLLYPPEAYDFVQKGLNFTVQQIHGRVASPRANRHVSGQQLCEGLREFALSQWGLLARTVLGQWEITSTTDFGRIVFHLIELGQMQKTDDDTLEDFQNVYGFNDGFDGGYQLPVNSI